ncbi:hypothetical protein Acr_00g0081910 [Actinidia rufa]|uniref:Retrotransposon gag domain-containing protein n=1 Tax=Actinidia rufa TaxID=165716 RepID=A0A7J0DVR9_9ERIC|nr:hypothetical protein Acr_00g0081910 [Actinidia rufa]
MPPRNARGRAKSLTRARGVRGARGARRNLNEGDDHQESIMGGRASAPMGKLVRNTVQTMHVPVRAADSRATTAMKAFLQLRPPTFKGEPDPLMVEDWLEQVTTALDTILVTEEELRVLFASYQLQGDALQWWKTVEESVAKKWEPFRKAFLDYLLRFAWAFVSTEEKKAKQFMRGLRPFIRNKIVGNLIKVYSIMVSAVVAIEETLNETRKITNPKSQREGTSNKSEGRSFRKPKSSTTQQYACRRGIVGSYGIVTTYSVSSGIEGHFSIYLSTDFISVQTTGYNSAGSEDVGTCLCYDINSGTIGDNWIAGVAVGYLCCARYFTYV